MNLSHIQAFVQVAQHGSISEAARQLNCNRTKLSMGIKTLEKELDTQLFVRTGNNVSLSEAGKAIFKDCESMLNTSSRIRQTCRHISGTFNAEIWIARDDAIPAPVWQELAHKLNNKYPATTFNIVLASSGDLANLVETKQVDFAFGVDFEREDDPRITYSPIAKIRMMSVCKAGHPLSKMRRVSNEDLRNAMQASMAYLNEKDNPELKPFSIKYIGFSSFDYILRTINTEGAWGVLPEPLIRPLLRSENLSVIKHTYGLRQEEFCMFSSPGMEATPSMTWLCDKLSDYLFDF